MKTTIDKEFQLSEPLAKVWQYLSDPAKIVACVPGASITEKIDDRNYKGQVTSSFGPVKASYNGEVTISELDPVNHKMVLNGRGVDSKGKGSADMTMTGTLSGSDKETRVNFSMEISITGMLAQFGSRLIKDVSDQLLNQFIENFRSRLAGKEVDNAMSGTSMVGTVLKSTLGGIFGSDKDKP